MFWLELDHGLEDFFTALVINGKLKKIEHFMLNSRHRLILLPCSLDETRLQKLKECLNVPFDECHADHQEALRALRHASFPEVKLTGLKSKQWKDMGWQGPNPSTDFRVDLLEPSSMESVHDEGCV
ncbi:uncharacterized protein LOC103994960 isoform X1 [Musa acuminata AAA Group]|uniref:uncharacterized protein LOC103994960 isoform X1 n=1 Tax=Musa acuminata AAA Group TaxID=214697 RepID=UPI0031D3AA0A